MREDELESARPACRVRAARQIDGCQLALLRVRLRQASQALLASKRVALRDALHDLENDYAALCRAELEAPPPDDDAWRRRLRDWVAFHARLCETRAAFAEVAWSAPSLAPSWMRDAEAQ